MTINNFNFVKYDPEFMLHLLRHFPGSEAMGSTFYDYFLPPEQLVDLSVAYISREYNGVNLTKEVDFPFDIGLEGVISVYDVPPWLEIRTELRDGIYQVNVVNGLDKKPTRHLVIKAGPLGNGTHGFKAIFPGMFCPELYDKEFWKDHVFVK